MSFDMITSSFQKFWQGRGMLPGDGPGRGMTHESYSSFGRRSLSKYVEHMAPIPKLNVEVEKVDSKPKRMRKI